MSKILIGIIIAQCLIFSMLTQVQSMETIVPDTTCSWNWAVPIGKYDYCDIIPINGLIKVGTKIGEKRLGLSGEDAAPVLPILVYGLLDRNGNLLTEIEFSEIGYPNSDGYMLATISEESDRNRQVVINHIGQILPTPEYAEVRLFDRSYSAETADEYILYVNNKSYSVPKSKLEYEVDFKKQMTVFNVYSSCFLLFSVEYLYVFDFDGTLRYKTDHYLDDSPQGLIISDVQGRVGFVDFDGNLILPVSYRNLCQVKYVPGLFTYTIDMTDNVNDNRYRIMDINNPNAFVDLEYSGQYYIPDYENRLFYLSAYKQGEGDLYGVYNFDGKQILPFEYDYIGRCSDGLMRFERGIYTGYADLDGNVVYEQECYRDGVLSPSGIAIREWICSLSEFSEGLAVYADANSGWGYINLDFELIIRLSDVWNVSNFHDGLAAATFRDELVFINQQGEIVLAAAPGHQPWKYSNGFSSGLAVVSTRVPVTGGSSFLYDELYHGAVGIIALTSCY